MLKCTYKVEDYTIDVIGRSIMINGIIMIYLNEVIYQINW